MSTDLDLDYDPQTWKKGTCEILEEVLDMDDISGVIMLVEKKAGFFSAEELDSASDMLGFEGIDLLPHPVLVFYPDSLNLMYNERDLFEKYCSEAVSNFPEASKIEIFWAERSLTSCLVYDAGK